MVWRDRAGDARQYGENTSPISSKRTDCVDHTRKGFHPSKNPWERLGSFFHASEFLSFRHKRSSGTNRQRMADRIKVGRRGVGV
jgi:hypothetical protein